MTLAEVLCARRRIAPYVRRTPLVHSAWLSEPLTRARFAEARIAAAVALLQDCAAPSTRSSPGSSAPTRAGPTGHRVSRQSRTRARGGRRDLPPAAGRVHAQPMRPPRSSTPFAATAQNCAPTAATTTKRRGWRRCSRARPAPISSRPTAIPTSSRAPRRSRWKFSKTRRTRARWWCRSAAAD